jgi:hypothetical protein
MVAAARRLPRASAEPVDAGDGASALRFFAIAVLGGGVLAAGAWVAWPAPGKFSRESRLAEVVAPRRAEVHYQTLELHAETAGLELAASAFRSAVATQPADLRPFMAGTLIGGESQTGAFSNQPFIVQERFLSVLYSGWPNIAGNGLRWYLRDPKSEAEEWVSLVQSSNPGNDLACWQIDAALWQGWEASLVLFAGRTDAFGWVGVMPPVSSNDAQFGRTWLAGLRAERAEATHRVLAAAVAGAAILALILGGLARRARRRERAAAAN